ncbi:caspase family protein, partial [Aetokthonos hydrillicola]
MAKYGLLIGASEYQSDKLKPLPGVVQDIKSMQRILQDPNIGGFAGVKLLENSASNAIQLEIERLFIKQCQEDDILLLYFSGHGFRDENGYLYFASHDTEIDEHSSPYTATAVSARFLQEQCMNRSKSKRQVLILDCCFSGAFAHRMSAREILPSIDKEIEQQLGGEGRAVLTSSTSAQVSFEDEGGGVYTRYLVEGIEKGAAADNNGMITVASLHEYAKRKVQSAQPAMKPEIFAVKEGYTICLAKAPVGDPELEYRKEVEECVKKGAFLVQDDRFS